MSELKAVLAEMRALRSPENIAGMKRFGIAATNALGLTTPEIRQIARNIGRDQPLAEQLWKTGIHDAKILAGHVEHHLAVLRQQRRRG